MCAAWSWNCANEKVSPPTSRGGSASWLGTLRIRDEFNFLKQQPGKGTFDSCRGCRNRVRYFKFVKKPNKFQKFNSEFLSSYVKNQMFELSREVPNLGLFFFLFFFFVFFLCCVFMLFLVSLSFRSVCRCVEVGVWVCVLVCVCVGVCVLVCVRVGLGVWVCVGVGLGVYVWSGLGWVGSGAVGIMNIIVIIISYQFFFVIKYSNYCFPHLARGIQPFQKFQFF